MTVGGTTNVKDGTTLPPRTSRITPNVYPTTTNTPDPELNNRPTKVSTSGSSGPSCTANCFGGCEYLKYPTTAQDTCSYTPRYQSLFRWLSNMPPRVRGQSRGWIWQWI